MYPGLLRLPIHVNIVNQPQFIIQVCFISFLQVCLAYRGNIRSSFLVRYNYDGAVRGHWFSNDFNGNSYDEWNYICMDLFADYIQGVVSMAAISINYICLFDYLSKVCFKQDDT